MRKSVCACACMCVCVYVSQCAVAEPRSFHNKLHVHDGVEFLTGKGGHDIAALHPVLVVLYHLDLSFPKVCHKKKIII